MRSLVGNPRFSSRINKLDPEYPSITNEELLSRLHSLTMVSSIMGPMNHFRASALVAQPLLSMYSRNAASLYFKTNFEPLFFLRKQKFKKIVVYWRFGAGKS